jgi:hypothetical protein
MNNIESEDYIRLKREQMLLISDEKHINDDDIAFAIVFQYLVNCRGNADEVLEKAKEVMLVVNNNLLKEILTLEKWSPTISLWQSTVPQWFIDVCTEEKVKKSVKSKWPFEKAWSFESWISWLLPTDRIWIWRNAKCISKNKIFLEVEVTDMPFPSETLYWLFLASGAISLDETIGLPVNFEQIILKVITFGYYTPKEYTPRTLKYVLTYVFIFFLLFFGFMFFITFLSCLF